MKDVIDQAVAKFPCETEGGIRDRRRDCVKRALDELCEQGLLQADGEFVIKPDGGGPEVETLI